MFSKNRFQWLLFSLPLIFLALFYFYPLARIGFFSFFSAGQLDGDKLFHLINSPVYGKILWFTLWQATASTVITVILALPGAYIFAKYQFPGKRFLQSLMIIPFVLPTVVTAAAFKALLGPNGVINSVLLHFFDFSSPPIVIDQTIFFFLLAHVFYNYTLVVRIVSSYWAGLDQNIIEAAKLLGASPLQTFLRIILPMLAPAIGSAALLVFIFCFTSFGVVLILGGPQYATIEVEIYRQAVQLFNLPMAASLSLLQIALNFLLMWIHAKISKESRVGFYGDRVAQSSTVITTGCAGAMVMLNLVFMILLLISPLLALVISSFTGEHGFTFIFFTSLFSVDSRSVFYVEPISAVFNSLGFGCSAMVLGVVLGMSASIFLRSNASPSLWDAIFMLPLATSAVTLGFGYIITLNKAPLNLRDSIMLIPIAHALVAFPFVVRCILPALRQIPQSLREAASMLGASPLLVWCKIDLPLIKQAVLVASIFAFLISMGEFGASAFIVRPHTPTMPVAIFRFLSQPGQLNYGQAMAMSTILMIVSVISVRLLSLMDRNLPIQGKQ